MGEKKIYEAVLSLHDGEGTTSDHIDPVVKIIIDNGHHQYEYNPEDLLELKIKRIGIFK